MSGREQLVLVRPRGKLLVMTGLVYPKKIKNPADYEGEVDEIDFKPEEVALANTLIGASKIDEFDFTKNSDQYVAVEASDRPDRAPEKETMLAQLFQIQPNQPAHVATSSKISERDWLRSVRSCSILDSAAWISNERVRCN